jgi:hypothetical protein
MIDTRTLAVEPSEKRATPTKQKAVSGTPIYGGYIQSGESNANLQGSTKYITYSNNVSNVSIIGASVAYFLALIAKANWRVEPADETMEAAKKAEWVETVLDEMEISWTRVVKRAAMYKMYGFSLQEWTAKKLEDGTIGFKCIKPVAQKTVEKWDTDKHGNIKGIVQRSPQDGKEIYLPMEKLVYFVDDAVNDSPEGLGVFRLIAETAAELRRFEQLEGFGYETDLRGIPVGKAPLSELQEMVRDGDLTQNEVTAILAPFKLFMQNHIKGPSLGLMLDSATYRSDDESASPSGADKYSVELLSSSSSSQEAIGEAIVRKQQEIARVFGTENLLVGSNSGSNALSKDKSQTFRLTVDSVLRELSRGFDYLIDVLWDLNGYDKKKKPTLSTEALQFDDVTAVTQALRDLALSGAPLDPNDQGIVEVRRMVGLSPPLVPEEEEEMSLIGGAKKPPSPSDPDERFSDQRLPARNDDSKTDEEKESMERRQREKMVQDGQAG